MPVPDPPWKIRTRPCPFYSSGRCLFASACNFEHVVRSSLTPLDDVPRTTSKIWTTRGYFGLDQDKPQNFVDSDNNEEEDEDEAEQDTIDWSKRSSYTLPSVDRYSLSSTSSLSRTETGTVRGRPLSLVIPSVPSGDSLNDNTLVDTTNGAESDDDYDKLEKRRTSIRFSDSRYQTTPFDLDVLSANSVQQRRRSQAATTLSKFADPPSPSPSIPQLDTHRVQYNGNRTRSGSEDSDGASSRRTSLLSDEPGSPRSDYQELEVVNTQLPLTSEFQLALPEASSLIANRTVKGGLGRLPVSTQDPDSRASRPAPEPEREQGFNPLQPPSIIFEHGQYDSIDATPISKHSRTDSDDQLLRFIPTAPLTLEPPTPNPDESPSLARQRFHRAFRLVTKELRVRVKHLKEPGTPLPGGSFQPAVESGDGGVLEAVNLRSTSEPAPLQGGVGNNSKEEQELGYLISTVPRSESPLLYEAEEELSVGWGRQNGEVSGVRTALGGSVIAAPTPVEVELKSPSWLKPLRLSTVFPPGRGPLIFQPPQGLQQVPQPYPHLQPQSRIHSQPPSQPPTPLSTVGSRHGSGTSNGDRHRSSRRATRSFAAAAVDRGPVPPRKSLEIEVPPVPPLPGTIPPSPSPFTPSAYTSLSAPPANDGLSPFTPSMYMLPSAIPTPASDAPARPLASPMAEELYQPQSPFPSNSSPPTWEPQSPRHPSIASSIFSGSVVPPSSRGSSMFQFRMHGRNETNSTNLSIPLPPDIPHVPPVPPIPPDAVRVRPSIPRSRSAASSRSNPRIASPLQPSPSPVANTSTPLQVSRTRHNSIMHSRPPSVLSFYSSTPSAQTSVKHPRLFFAIASSQPEEVARLLQTGEADANETVGPEDMHALAFAMESLKDGNEGDLSRKEEIVTTLLSYGADPSAVEDEGNAYVKYFLDKAAKSPVAPEEVKDQDAMEEAPLARARFVIVGQEYGVMELVRSYRAHVRLAKYLADDKTELPFVALLTGPSGHGKTHLATRIGSLLGTRSYSVNMTLVRSQKDFWETVSSRPDEAARFSSLREYLTAHDGRPGVVVVDELEKVYDKTYLQALLVPWENGRVQRISGHPLRSVDISKIVWMCTSNVASQDIIKHSREGPRTQEWFEGLRLIARIQLGDELGASLLARVSVVIPFVTFTEEERLAISSQALSGLKRNLVTAKAEQLHKVTNWEEVVARAAKAYVESEGARSIRRGIVKWTDVVLRGARLS